MLQTTIEWPQYWREFHHQLETYVRLLSQPVPEKPVSKESAPILAGLLALARDILGESATVTFVEAYDALSGLREQALARSSADPSDLWARVLKDACAAVLAHLLALRCGSAYVASPLPASLPSASRLGLPAGSGPLINYSVRGPIIEVQGRLDAPPPAIVQMLMAERLAEAGLDAGELRQGGSQVTAEAVHFNVSAPRTVTPGSAFLVDIWAFLATQRVIVEERARAAAADASFFMRGKGPSRVSRGTVLTVCLAMPGFIVDDPEDTLVWEGEAVSTALPVSVPGAMPPGDKAGSVVVHASGLRVAKLHFTIRVAAGERADTDVTPVHAERKLVRSAFASYASENRDEVLNVIQGLEKALPGIDVFLDVAKLRSGESWQDRLWAEIPGRDVFFLFWSEAASRSPWVEKEWRCALETRGIGFIDPVPLVSPEIVPPPKELGDLHFNDWVLAFKRRRNESGRPTAT